MFQKNKLGARSNLVISIKEIKNPYCSDNGKPQKKGLIEIDKDGDLELLEIRFKQKLRLEKVKGIAVNNIWTDIS